MNAETGRKVKVLVIDDSAIVRKLLSEHLATETDIEVVGTAPDPYVARDKIFQLRPDVLTLDIEMPRMDGLTFLKRLMHFQPMPVVVISSLAQSSAQTALDCLREGAVDVLAKPGGPYSVGDLKMCLAARIRAAAVSRVRVPARQEPLESLAGEADAAPVPAPALAAAGPSSPAAAPAPAARAQPRARAAAPPPRKAVYKASPNDLLIAIGASTGGTEAIHAVLTQLPGNTPPVVITQHIPPVFSRAFAERLNQVCAMEVREAADGDELRPGLALVAPGNLHMLVKRGPAGYRVVVKTGPPVCYQRPSVDVLFHSVAEAAGRHAVGVLLTGMGADGAQGLLKMRQSGAHTIAQDEASCVVFGMPREAIKLGGADRVLPLNDIARAMLAAK